MIARSPIDGSPVDGSPVDTDPTGRGAVAWEEEASSGAWSPAMIPAADRLFWLEPAGLRPTSGTSPYACTSWVNSWADGSGDFTVLTGTPNIVDPSAVHFTGSRRVGLVEADTDAFLAGGAASIYKPFHDGTGVTLAVAFLSIDPDTTQMICATDNTTATNHGFFLRFDGGANERCTITIHDGSGTALISIVTATDTFLSGAANVVVVELKDRTPGVGGTGTMDLGVWANSVIVAAAELPASPLPSTTNPQAAFTLGRRGGQASEWFEGNLYHVIGARGTYGAQLAAYMERLRV